MFSQTHARACSRAKAATQHASAPAALCYFYEFGSAGCARSVVGACVRVKRRASWSRAHSSATAPLSLHIAFGGERSLGIIALQSNASILLRQYVMQTLGLKKAAPVVRMPLQHFVLAAAASLQVAKNWFPFTQKQPSQQRACIGSMSQRRDECPREFETCSGAV